MTTETDDLNYYETELPKIIAGVRRGEKWEVMWLNPPDGNPKWVNPIRHDLEYLLDQINYRDYRVRLAPVPVVRPWSEPADVPGPVCWLRGKPEEGMNQVQRLVTIVSSYGGDFSHGGRFTWEEIHKWEHSTDRIHWSPCVKPEGGK